MATKELPRHARERFPDTVSCFFNMAKAHVQSACGSISTATIL